MYLKMISPHIDHTTRTELANSILALLDGQNRNVPPKKITDAQIVEMVWRNSECVFNRTGRCPLHVFGKQLAEEINEFFKGDE